MESKILIIYLIHFETYEHEKLMNMKNSNIIYNPL